jgi:hypothetical protein
MIRIDLMSVRLGIGSRKLGTKKGRAIARFQAEWAPVSRPESALFLSGRAIGRKTGTHFC